MKKYFSLIMLGGILFALPTLATSDLGVLRENVTAGKTISVGLNASSSGNWYMGSNSNPSVAQGSITLNNSLLIKAIATGNAKLLACQDTSASHCLEVNVSVSSAGSVLGANIAEAHPPKSWIISNKTVFYVYNNSLIPVTTWKIFINNGGKANLIQPANSGDLSLSLQSFMTLKDARVVK